MTALTIRRWLVRMVALYSMREELVGQERALGALGFTRGVQRQPAPAAGGPAIDGQQPASTAFRRWAARRPSSCSEPSATPVWILNSCGGSPVPSTGCRRRGNGTLRWFGLQTQRRAIARSGRTAIDDLLDATYALLADDAPGWQAGGKTMA